MAHRLKDHNGKCRNIHGHSWEIEFFVSAPELQRSGPSAGMLVDYSVMKKALEAIDLIFDHALCLDLDDPVVNLLVPLHVQLEFNLRTYVTANGFASFEDGSPALKLVFVDFPPTSENLAILWMSILEKGISTPFVHVCRIEVKETCTSKAIITV